MQGKIAIWRSERGSVALLFALSAAALFGAVGGLRSRPSLTARQSCPRLRHWPANTRADRASCRRRVELFRLKRCTRTSRTSRTTSPARSETSNSARARRTGALHLPGERPGGREPGGDGAHDLDVALRVTSSGLGTRMLRHPRQSSCRRCRTARCSRWSTKTSRPGCGSGPCAFYYGPDGTAPVPARVDYTFTSSPAYTGGSGRKWYVIGTCLEIDNVGTIESTVPDGSHSAELDRDGNSSMSSNYCRRAITSCATSTRRGFPTRITRRPISAAARRPEGSVRYRLGEQPAGIGGELRLLPDQPGQRLFRPRPEQAADAPDDGQPADAGRSRA